MNTRPVTTRPAQPDDAAAMCAILNAIIAIGGTTAYEEPFDIAHMIDAYILHPRLIRCTLALVEGEVAGFQAIWRPDPDDPHPLPADWAYIASFVQPGRAGQGIGGHLFRATLAAAREAGVTAIDATIRADNQSGLTYYASRGFRDYDVIPAVPLRDGRPVDRIRKMFPLDGG